MERKIPEMKLDRAPSLMGRTGRTGHCSISRKRLSPVFLAAVKTEIQTTRVLKKTGLNPALQAHETEDVSPVNWKHIAGFHVEEKGEVSEGEREGLGESE